MFVVLHSLIDNEISELELEILILAHSLWMGMILAYWPLAKEAAILQPSFGFFGGKRFTMCGFQTSAAWRSRRETMGVGAQCSSWIMAGLLILSPGARFFSVEMLDVSLFMVRAIAVSAPCIPGAAP